MRELLRDTPTGSCKLLELLRDTDTPIWPWPTPAGVPGRLDKERPEGSRSGMKDEDEAAAAEPKVIPSSLRLEK